MVVEDGILDIFLLDLQVVDILESYLGTETGCHLSQPWPAKLEGGLVRVGLLLLVFAHVGNLGQLALGLLGPLTGLLNVVLSGRVLLPK